MRKSHEADSHSTCSTANQRKRGLARFSLRRLLYSSPLVARRVTRGTSSTSKNSRSTGVYAYVQGYVSHCHCLTPTEHLSIQVTLINHYTDWACWLKVAVLISSVCHSVCTEFHKCHLLPLIFMLETEVRHTHIASWWGSRGNLHVNCR